MKLDPMRKQLFSIALASCPILLAMPSFAQQQRSITITGTVLPQCAFATESYRGNRARILLRGNRGSISTICNTGSTLSVSIDRAASKFDGDSQDRDLKIRFAAGGTGIYVNAHQDRNYRETAIFRSQRVTSAQGDTAQFEVKSSDRDRRVDPPTQNDNQIFVYASLTPQ
jgi:hypothetical protein